MNGANRAGRHVAQREGFPGPFKLQFALVEYVQNRQKSQDGKVTLSDKTMAFAIYA